MITVTVTRHPKRNEDLRVTIECRDDEGDIRQIWIVEEEANDYQLRMWELQPKPEEEEDGG